MNEPSNASGFSGPRDERSTKTMDEMIVTMLRLLLPSGKRTFAYRPWHFIVNVFAASRLIHDEQRPFLLAVAGLDVHRDAIVHTGCFFASSKISIGARSMINRGCYFENPDHDILIGEHCFLGPEVM